MSLWDRLKIYNSVFALALAEGILMMFLPMLSYLFPPGAVRELTYSFTYFLSLFIPTVIGYISFRPGRTAPRQVASAPVVTFACLGIITAAAYLNAIVIAPFAASGAIVNTQNPLAANSTAELLMLIISTVVIPPVAEELFFRGFVLKRLMPLGSRAAIVVSALIFAMFHSNVAQFIYTFAAGLAFGAVTVMTGRVRYAVIIHGINNLIAVILVPLYSLLGEDIMWRLTVSLDTALILSGLASLLFMVFARQKDPTRYSLPQREPGENEAPFRAISPFAILYLLFVLFQTALINLPLL